MNPFDVARWSHPLQLLAALALGGVSVLAFAPFNIGLLALFALAALLHLLWHAASAAHAARIGYAFGLGLLGFGVFWLRISINQFGGVSETLAIAITSLFVAFVALYFALAAWLIKRAGRGRSQAVFMLLLAPAAWLLIEWLRGWLFTGFPWLSLGYSQIDLPLAGFVPLLGVYGAGALLVMSAGLINLWRQVWPALAMLGIWAGGLALSWQDWTSPAGEPIQVSLVQANIPQEDKWKRHLFAPSVRLYRELTEQVPDSHLVIWPETAIAAFDDEVEEGVLQPLHALMQGQGRDLLTGIVSRDEEGRYYNAMISLGQSGRHHYHKRHLVPFGEYLPFKPLLDPVLGFLEIPMSDFSVGNGGKPLVPLAGSVAGVDICYEDAFAGEVMRALPEAAFLVNASNDAWFGDSLAPHQHLQIARMRALESGRYLLRATNTGISAIINTRGELRGTAPQFEQAVLSDRIQPMQGMTPFARWRDWPLLLLSAAALLLAWRRAA
jgi:apolipoprotein N-acyltransferase